MFKKAYPLQAEVVEAPSGGAPAAAPAAQPAAAPAAPPAASAAPPSNQGDPAKPDAAPTPIWSDDWRKQIAGDDEKAQKQLSRYQSPKEIWDKARALEQRLSSGELKSVMPKDATPEQLAAWRAENGIPAVATGYDIAELVSEEDRPIINGYLESMHGTNATPAQVKAGVEWYYKEVARVNEEIAQRDKEFASRSEEVLRAEWGQEYKLNLNQINGLLETAPAAVRDQIAHGRLANGNPLMSDPNVMKWLNSMARQINPVTTVIPNAGGNIANAIADEIAQIQNVLKTDRKRYNEDPKMQSRLAELLGAQERMSK